MKMGWHALSRTPPRPIVDPLQSEVARLRKALQDERQSTADKLTHVDKLAAQLRQEYEESLK